MQGWRELTGGDSHAMQNDGEYPDPRLWHHERVVITPHVSGGTDQVLHRGIEVFCTNLRAFLDGRPLLNQIDWQRGY